MSNVKDAVISKKRENLTELLINKFRGKFKCNANSQLDQIIIAEVKKVLDQGAPSETALNKLDIKLRNIADTIASGKKSLAMGQEQRAQSRMEDDCKSYYSSRSLRSSKSVNTSKMGTKIPSTYHVDPSATLNPTEEQWN